MSRQKSTDASRRNFLKTLGVAGTAASAAALAGNLQAASEAEPDTAATQAEGYRETPHIRSYYDSLRK